TRLESDGVTTASFGRQRDTTHAFPVPHAPAAAHTSPSVDADPHPAKAARAPSKAERVREADRENLTPVKMGTDGACPRSGPREFRNGACPRSGPREFRNGACPRSGPREFGNARTRERTIAKGRPGVS